MKIKLRKGRPDDAQRSGSICYEAFRVLAEHHRFPPDFPSTDGCNWIVVFAARAPGHLFRGRRDRRTPGWQ
jgi:hypothetical protein